MLRGTVMARRAPSEPPSGSQRDNWCRRTARTYVKPLLLLEPAARRGTETRSKNFRKIPLDSRAVSDLLMLAMGAYTPLAGFMGHEDWRGSCVDMKLTSGAFWPIPITLPVDKSVSR